MRVFPEQSVVPGATPQAIERHFLLAGAYDLRAGIGRLGATGTATIRVRPARSSTDLVSAGTTSAEANVGPSRFVAAADGEFDFLLDAGHAQARARCRWLEWTPAAEQWANAARTTLAAPLASGGASMTVSAGAAFPSPGTGQHFHVAIEDAVGNLEIVRVGVRSGSVFSTLLRGQGGTSPRDWLIGALVELRIVVETLELLRR